MARNQAELPTLERTTNEKLDEKVAAYLEARKVHGDATRTITEAKAALTAAMHEFEEDLPSNADGDPVYVFHDGENEHASVLLSSESLKVKKISADEDPQPDLG